jgi:hypothetical protein
MPEAAWFGVEVPPTEQLMPVIIASGAPKFLAANWGRGFAVAVPEKFAAKFEKLAVSRGWRVKRVEPPELPALRYYEVLTGVWPVKPEHSPRFGGLVAEVKRGGAYRKLLASIDRQYTVKVAPGAFIRTPMPPDVAQARASAEAYKVAVVAFPFVFDEEGGSAKLAEKVAELKVPRPRGWFTPLDAENFLALPREGGMYTPRGPFAGMYEFDVKLAGNLVLTFGEKRDNSVLLCGAPGTGKSIVLDTMLARVPAWWTVLVLDPTGEHTVLGKLPPSGGEGRSYAVLRAGVDVLLNPLALGPAGAFDVLAGVIEGYWGERLTPIVAQTLMRAVHGSRNLAEVYEKVEKVLAGSSREDERNAAAALLRRLEPLLSCPALYGSEEAEPLPAGRTVIDMSTIESEAAKAAFALTALHLAYVSAKLGKWRGIVVVEEADRLGDCDVVNRIADELRQYGVSAWAVGHSLARIARKLADAHYQLYFATSDPDTLKVVDPERRVLPKLAFAQAYVHVRGRTPFTASLLFDPEIARSKKVFAARPPLPVSDVAMKHGVDPRRLAQHYSELRQHARAVVKFVRGEASREEAEPVRSLSPPMLRALAELYQLAGLA